MPADARASRAALLRSRSGGTTTGLVVGGVLVAPRASELIYPLSLAVDLSLTAEQVATAFTVYPSLSGSLAEAARVRGLSES